jgi:ribosome recycling factor
MKLMPDTVAEIFSLLDVSEIRLGGSDRYTIDVTDRITVSYLKNGGTWFADLRLDDCSISLPADDRAAFVKWWDDNHKQKIAQAVSTIEHGLDCAVQFYHDHDTLRIEDY